MLRIQPVRNEASRPRAAALTERSLEAEHFFADNRHAPGTS